MATDDIAAEARRLSAHVDLMANHLNEMVSLLQMHAAAIQNIKRQIDASVAIRELNATPTITAAPGEVRNYHYGPLLQRFQREWPDDLNLNRGSDE